MIELSRSALIGAVVAGVAVGVAYATSPSLVICGVALGGIVTWAQRGTSPRERRWVIGLLVASLALRALVLAGFFLFGGSRESLPVLVGDEWLIKWRSLLLVNLALGRPLAPPDYFNVLEAYGRTSLMNVFGVWQYVVGPAPYGVHLLNVVFWFAAAVLMFRTARRAFGPIPAWLGLVMLLCMPTLFVWSVSALKEPLFFLMTALALAGAYGVLTGPGVGRRLLGACALAAGCWGIDPIRSSALFVTAGGVAVGVIGWLMTRRAWPWALAAVLALTVGGRVLSHPRVATPLTQAIATAANYQRGSVRTVGYSYLLLDQHYYMDYGADGIRTMPWDEAGRYVVRAIGSFVIQPIPWEAKSRAMVVFIGQQMLWYLLFAFAGIGAVAGWRRDATLTWIIIGYFIVAGAVVALFSGNIGTFVRFRDSVVTIIVWLSALGAAVSLEWAARRFSGDSRDASA